MPPLDLASALSGDQEALSGLLDQIADWLHGDSPNPLSASARRRYWQQQRADAIVDLAMALPRASTFDTSILVADILATPAPLPAENSLPAEISATAERVLDAQLNLGGGELTAATIYRILRDAAIQNCF